MTNSERKSFTNHKHNGVNLVFPNGNWISTIWGRGSYPENYHNVEIMIGTKNNRLGNKIFRKLGANPDNGVIGWVTMEQWMWVVNQLFKMPAQLDDKQK